MGCEMLLAGAWSHGSVRNKERHGRWRCVPPMSGMRVARGERRRLEPKPLNFANEVEELVNVDRLGDKTVCVTVLIFWIPMLWSTLTTPRRAESSALLKSCKQLAGQSQTAEKQAEGLFHLTGSITGRHFAGAATKR
jgi:hypothetical protein